MKNAPFNRLLLTGSLLLATAASCSKDPAPPVSCYRKDAGACKFADSDGGSGDTHNSIDAGVVDAGIADGGGSSVGPDTRIEVTFLDAAGVDTRPTIIDASPSDGAVVALNDARADGAGGSSGNLDAFGSLDTASIVVRQDGPTNADIDARVAAPDLRLLDTNPDSPDAGVDGSADAAPDLDAASDGDPAPILDAQDDVADVPLSGDAWDGPTPEMRDSGVDTAIADTAISIDAAPTDLPTAVCPSVTTARQYAVTSIGGLAVDGTGTPYLVAKLFDSADFGAGSVTSAGSSDVLVAKLDPSSLTATWSKAFSGTGESSNPTDQVPAGVAVSQSGQVGVIGNFTGNMVVNSSTTLAGGGSAIDFVMATDSAGNGLWGKAVDTQSGGLLAIAGHPARDEFVVCGYAMGGVASLGLTGAYNGDGLEDILVAKLNAATGDVIWARQIGAEGTQLCSAIALDATGVVHAAGTYNGTLDFGTGALPALGSSVQAIWVAKFDASTGSALVTKKYGTLAKQAVRGIAVDGTGAVAISGNLKGSVPFGATTLTSAGGTDGYLAKLDGNLDPLWATSWGDTANQESSQVGFTSTGDVLVVGYLKGSATFAGTPLTAAGLSDAYWTKFSAGGVGLCAGVYGDAERDQVATKLAVSPASAAQPNRVFAAGFATGSISFGSGLTFTSDTPKGFMFVLP